MEGGGAATPAQRSSDFDAAPELESCRNALLRCGVLQLGRSTQGTGATRYRLKHTRTTLCAVVASGGRAHEDSTRAAPTRRVELTFEASRSGEDRTRTALQVASTLEGPARCAWHLGGINTVAKTLERADCCVAAGRASDGIEVAPEAH